MDAEPIDSPGSLGPLTELESDLVRLLTEVGVDDPHPVEHGFRSAIVGGELDGRFIIVHSYEPGSPQEPPGSPVTAEITLDGGGPATVVTTTAYGAVVRFTCSGWGYQVASLDRNLTPGSSQVDDARRVAGLLAAALDCA